MNTPLFKIGKYRLVCGSQTWLFRVGIGDKLTRHQRDSDLVLEVEEGPPPPYKMPMAVQIFTSAFYYQNEDNLYPIEAGLSGHQKVFNAIIDAHSIGFDATFERHTLPAHVTYLG